MAPDVLVSRELNHCRTNSRPQRRSGLQTPRNRRHLGADRRLFLEVDADMRGHENHWHE
jgi:hypothetical protein